MNRQLLIFSFVVFAFLSGVDSMAHSMSENEPIVFISELKILESKTDEAIDLLSDLQLQTLEGEDGCIIYDVMISEEDATKVFIYESYESESAYNKHLKSKHYSGIFTKQLKPMLKEFKTTKVFLLNFEGGYSDAEI